MCPNKSGIVLKITVYDFTEISVHLTKSGTQNWTRTKYYNLISEFYRSLRSDPTITEFFVIMRVYKPSGAQMLYDEMLNKFVPIGKPGSDRENFLLGYPFGGPALFGTKAWKTELEEEMRGARERALQLPRERQREAAFKSLREIFKKAARDKGVHGSKA